MPHTFNTLIVFLLTHSPPSPPTLNLSDIPLSLIYVCQTFNVLPILVMTLLERGCEKVLLWRTWDAVITSEIALAQPCKRL